MMLKKRLPFLFLLCFLAHTSLLAQSPYGISWKKDGIIAGTGLATAVVGTILSDSIKPLTLAEVRAADRNTINVFDRGATNNFSLQISHNSDFVLGALALSPALLLLDKDRSGDALALGVMYAETLAFATFLPSIAKGSTQRLRPFVYNSTVSFEDKLANEPKASFFSGHTTIAFASAMFLSTVYSKYYPQSKAKKYVWIGSFLAASTVGLMRYESGAHFPTDIVVGAVVGSALGYLIPRLHEVKSKRVAIFPVTNGLSVGLGTVIHL